MPRFLPVEELFVGRPPMADHSREEFGYRVLWLGIHWQAGEIQPSNILLARNVSPAVPAALADTRAGLQHGARQTGRGPLARSLAAHSHPAAPGPLRQHLRGTSC